MKPLYSVVLVGLGVLGLVSCSKDPAPALVLPCTRVTVLGPSCNGTLLGITDGASVGKPVTYNGTTFQNVVGTYSTLPDTLAFGDELLIGLREATPDEAAPRPCIAIYQSFDVPQMVVEIPRCPK